MAQRLHLPHRRTAGAPRSEGPPHLGERVFAVQRIGAVLVALFLLVFAALGLAGGQEFFSLPGEPVLGMSSNGLLSTLSVVVALVLLGAAAHGPRTASTVMLVLGPLFLLSAGVNAVVLGTRLNWLAFSLSNVLFSVVVGLLLLLLGAYGRIGGHLPPDSPYAHPPAEEIDYTDERPRTLEEAVAEEEMRAAEIAVAEHTATPTQYRRVRAVAPMHTRMERRRAWMELEAAEEGTTRRDGAGAAPLPRPRAGSHLRFRRTGTRHG